MEPSFVQSTMKNNINDATEKNTPTTSVIHKSNEAVPAKVCFVFIVMPSSVSRGWLGGYNPPPPPKMFSVCILFIDYNKNTKFKKNLMFHFLYPPPSQKKKFWIRHWLCHSNIR
jgi:hypothetical protein